MRQNDITRLIHLESYHTHYNIQLRVTHFMHVKCFKIKTQLLYIPVKCQDLVHKI